MSRAVVNVHIFDKLTAKTVLGEHTFENTKEQGVHTGFEVLVVGFLHKHFGGLLALTAGIAGLVQVNLVGHLAAGENHFVGVDNDDVVAALYIG